MLSINLLSATRADWDKFESLASQGSRYELASIIPKGFEQPIYIRRSTSDVKSFAQIFLHREYDFIPLDLDSIIDCGGYIGLASAYFAARYPRARILLVEPDPDNFIMAQLNCRQFKNIECINAGVWPKTCELTVSSKIGGDWGTTIREIQPGDKVLDAIKAVSIGELFEKIGSETVDFVKIDIEGTEKIVFSDPAAKNWIRRSKIISCELHDRFMPGCSNAFHDAMKGEDFCVGSNGEYQYYISIIHHNSEEKYSSSLVEFHNTIKELELSSSNVILKYTPELNARTWIYCGNTIVNDLLIRDKRIAIDIYIDDFWYPQASIFLSPRDSDAKKWLEYHVRSLGIVFELDGNRLKVESCNINSVSTYLNQLENWIDRLLLNVGTSKLIT